MILKFIRDILSDKSDEYIFRSSVGENLEINKEGGLYIHIPFCKSMCPYCPYYKVLFAEELAQQFKSALILEIKRYAEEVGTNRFTSLYLGGGTPTLLIDHLNTIINAVKDNFNFDGPIAIETTPSDITKDKVRIMKEMGINYVSLGVQSFQQENLDCIGRNYNYQTAIDAANLIKEYKFETFNIDLIFAFPGEKLPQLLADLQKVIEISPDQITCYPLFTFPYSTIGKYKKIKKIKMPSFIIRKKMYYLIHDFLVDSGYMRSSVWSFNKPKTKPYSSVTRDYYIGLGPSAGSYTGKAFYFNTFSVREYIKTVSQRKPISLEMKVSQRMEKIFWLYWRLYETVIPIKRYETLFNESIYIDFGTVLRVIKALGFLEQESATELVLNKRGCHWIHLLQNYFALDYVSKIWSESQKNPWPEKVRL